MAGSRGGEKGMSDVAAEVKKFRSSVSLLQDMGTVYPMARQDGTVSLWGKCLWAAPVAGFQAMLNFKQFFMKPFYTDTPSIRASLGIIAVFAIISTLVDAFTDPAWANYTDNYRGHLGRRRPFLFSGAVGGVFVFTLGYKPLVPAGVAASVWYGVFHVGAKLVDTVAMIPHAAWAAELSPLHRERSCIFMFEQVATIVGIAAGSIAAPRVVDSIAERTTGYPLVMAFLSLAFLLPAIVLVCVGKERKANLLPTPNREKWTEDSIVATLIVACLNRPFHIVLCMTIVKAFGNGLPFLIMPYATRAVIGEVCLSANAQFGYYSAAYIAGMLLSCPAWWWLSSRAGKYRTIIVGNAFLVAAHCSFFFAARRDGEECHVLRQVLGLAFLWGFGHGSGFLIHSLLTDIIDYDEFLSGKRREAMYMMAVTFIPKFSNVIMEASLFMSMAYFGYERPGDWGCQPRADAGRGGERCGLQGPVFDAARSVQVMYAAASARNGFCGGSFVNGTACRDLAACCVREDPAQPPAIEWLIRVALSLGPAFVTALGLLVFLRYPRGARVEESHVNIMNGISRHRRGEAAEDPWFAGRVVHPPQSFLKQGGLLAHLWPSEVQAALAGGAAGKGVDFGAALRRAGAGFSFGLCLAVPGLYLITTGWRDLGVGLGASVSPLGFVLLGLSLLVVWFDGTRLQAVRELQRRQVQRGDVVDHYNEMCPFTGQRSLETLRGRDVPIAANDVQVRIADEQEDGSDRGSDRAGADLAFDDAPPHKPGAEREAAGTAAVPPHLLGKVEAAATLGTAAERGGARDGKPHRQAPRRRSRPREPQGLCPTISAMLVPWRGVARTFNRF